jgi:hypothetical protein
MMLAYENDEWKKERDGKCMFVKNRRRRLVS